MTVPDGSPRGIPPTGDFPSDYSSPSAPTGLINTGDFPTQNSSNSGGQVFIRRRSSTGFEVSLTNPQDREAENQNMLEEIQQGGEEKKANGELCRLQIKANIISAERDYYRTTKFLDPDLIEQVLKETGATDDLELAAMQNFGISTAGNKKDDHTEGFNLHVKDWEEDAFKSMVHLLSDNLVQHKTNSPKTNSPKTNSPKTNSPKTNSPLLPIRSPTTNSPLMPIRSPSSTSRSLLSASQEMMRTISVTKLENEEADTSLKWKLFKSDLFFPKYLVKDRDGLVASKCKGLVQTSPENLLSFFFAYESDWAMADHWERNGMDRIHFPRKIVENINAHHHITYNAQKMPFPITARDYLSRWVWRVDADDSFVIVSVPVTRKNLLRKKFEPSRLETVTGEFYCICKIERFKHNQSLVTYITKFDVKGSVNQKIVTSMTITEADMVRKFYDFFECDDKIDSIERNLFSDWVEKVPPLDKTELRMLTALLRTAGWQVIGGRLFRVDGKMGLDPKRDNKKTLFWSEFNAGNSSHNGVHTYIKKESTTGLSWGKVVAKVDASQKEVLAWLWDARSNYRTRLHLKTEGNLPRTVDSIEGQEGMQVLRYQKKMAMGYLNQEIEVKMFLSKFGDNQNEVYVIGFHTFKESGDYGRAGVFEAAGNAVEVGDTAANNSSYDSSRHSKNGNQHEKQSVRNSPTPSKKNLFSKLFKKGPSSNKVQLDPSSIIERLEDEAMEMSARITTAEKSGSRLPLMNDQFSSKLRTVLPMPGMDFGTKEVLSAVKAKSKGTFIIRHVSDFVSEVAYVNQMELTVPANTNQLSRAASLQDLTIVSHLQRYFKRQGKAVDREIRNHFISRTLPASIDDTSDIDSARAFINEMNGILMKSMKKKKKALSFSCACSDDKVKLYSASKYLDSDVSCLRSHFEILSMKKVKKRYDYMKGEVLVDATLGEALAWLWDQSSSTTCNRRLRKKVAEKRSDYEQIVTYWEPSSGLWDGGLGNGSNSLRNGSNKVRKVFERQLWCPKKDKTGFVFAYERQETEDEVDAIGRIVDEMEAVNEGKSKKNLNKLVEAEKLKRKKENLAKEPHKRGFILIEHGGRDTEKFNPYYILLDRKKMSPGVRATDLNLVWNNRESEAIPDETNLLLHPNAVTKITWIEESNLIADASRTGERQAFRKIFSTLKEMNHDLGRPSTVYDTKMTYLRMIMAKTKSFEQLERLGENVGGKAHRERIATLKAEKEQKKLEEEKRAEERKSARKSARKQSRQKLKNERRQKESKKEMVDANTNSDVVYTGTSVESYSSRGDLDSGGSGIVGGASDDNKIPAVSSLADFNSTRSNVSQASALTTSSHGGDECARADYEDEYDYDYKMSPAVMKATQPFNFDAHHNRKPIPMIKQSIPTREEIENIAFNSEIYSELEAEQIKYQENIFQNVYDTYQKIMQKSKGEMQKLKSDNRVTAMPLRYKKNLVIGQTVVDGDFQLVAAHIWLRMCQDSVQFRSRSKGGHHVIPSQELINLHRVRDTYNIFEFINGRETAHHFDKLWWKGKDKKSGIEVNDGEGGKENEIDDCDCVYIAASVSSKNVFANHKNFPAFMLKIEQLADIVIEGGSAAKDDAKKALFEQCKVTLIDYFSEGVSYLSVLRKQFSQDDAIDSSRRTGIEKAINLSIPRNRDNTVPGAIVRLNAFERANIKNSVTLYKCIDESSGLRNKIVQIPGTQARLRVFDNGDKLWILVDALVSGTSVEVFAFLWDVLSRTLSKNRKHERSIVPSTALTRDMKLGDCSQTLCVLESHKRGLSKFCRKVCSVMTWSFQEEEFEAAMGIRSPNGFNPERSYAERAFAGGRQQRAYAERAPAIQRHDKGSSTDKKNVIPDARERTYLIACSPASLTGDEMTFSSDTRRSFRPSANSKIMDNFRQITRRDLSSSCMQIAPLANNKMCRISYVFAVDTQLFNFSKIESTLVNTHELHSITCAQKAFTKLKKISEIGPSDGIQIGLLLTKHYGGIRNWWLAKEAHSVLRGVESIFGSYAVMKHFFGLFPFFEAMVISLTGNESDYEKRYGQTVAHSDQGWRERAKSLPHNMKNLSTEDGFFLGEFFRNSSLINGNAEDVVDSFINTFPALVECKRKFPFFESMMLVISTEQKSKVTTEKLIKSGGSCAFGMTDLVTDLYAVSYYFMSGEETLGQLMLTFILTATMLQLIIVFVNHRHSPRTCFTEMVYTAFMVKCGINKFRVLTNQSYPPESRTIIAPIGELISLKLCEVFSESIPCTLIQVIGLLRSDNYNTVLTLSLISSAIFTAEGIIWLTYTTDNNADLRRQNPIFFGFVPLVGVRRKLLQVSMMTMSFSHLLTKCMTYSMLWRAGKEVFLLIFGVDLLLYILYKFLRQDLSYFLRLDGKLRFFMSLFMRLVSKIVNDFTAMPHLRSPYELGGFYWCYSMIWSLATGLYALHISKEGEGEGEGEGESKGKEGIDYNTLEMICLSLWLLWAGSFASTILFCNPNFRHTFFNTKTSKMHSLDNFLHGDDESRMSIFTRHESLWRPFAGQVKSWLNESWEMWYIEAPVWFNDHTIALIPEDMLPAGVEEMTAQKRTYGRSRRRSSISSAALEAILQNAVSKTTSFARPTTETQESVEHPGFIISD